jgi:hypothetical protein
MSSVVKLITRIDDKPIKDKFGRMRQMGETEIVRAMNDVLDKHERRWVKRFRKYPGPKAAVEGAHPDDAVYSRTGATKKSYRRTLAQKVGGEIRASAQVRGPHVRLQEHGTRILSGGAITPRKGQYLTVPLPAALTPTGRPRFAGNLRKGPTGWTTPDGKEAQLRVSPGGQPVIWAKFGAVWRPIYVLRRRVTFPGRLGFFDSWKTIKQFRRLRLGKALEKVVKA